MSTATGLFGFFDEMFSEINSYWERVIIFAEQRRPQVKSKQSRREPLTEA